MHRIRIVLLVLLLGWPLGLRAQQLRRDGIPKGMTDPDSLWAWVHRPGLADTTRVNLLNACAADYTERNLDSAFAYNAQALRLARRIHFSRGLIGALNIRGAAYYYASDYPAAQRAFEQLLREAQAAVDYQSIGHAYLGLGNVAHELHDEPASQTYFARAQQAYASCTPRHKMGEVLVLHNRVNGYLDADNAAAARPLLRQAFGLARNAPPQWAFGANLWLQLGSIQQLEHQPDSARASWQHAAELARTTHYLQAEATARQHLAELAQQQRQYPQALAHAQYASRMLRTLGDPERLAGALHTQAAALAALHQPGAYDTLLRAATLRDTLYNQERLQAVADAQARFSQAEQQARIRALRQQQRISQLRAAQQATRARQYAALAGGLLLLLGVVLYSRRRLQTSEAALRRANHTQRELLRIIGHDLRGPVALFQQVTPLLQQSMGPTAPPEATTLVQELDGSARHLGALVDNLLDWARLQSDLVSNRPVALPAATAVLEVQALYEPAARRKHLTVLAEADPALRVQADLNLLLTVLRNLLANAIKFTPAGGTVRVAAEATVGGTVCFSVTDTGRGLPPAALATLLADGPVDSQPGTAGEPGTGLGLPLCRRFVALLGGTLRAEATREGPGLRFWFELPAA